MPLNSALWELGRNREVQECLRAEVLTTRSSEQAQLEHLPYLLATIYEVLRLYPPLFHMTNRVTLTPNAHEGQANERAWPNGTKFFPDRWGTTVEDIEKRFRRAQSQGTFIAFNAHALRSVSWEVEPEYSFKTPPAGTMTPIDSRLRFRKLNVDHVWYRNI
ncbi:MAG: hypothetical protein Q9181_002484 [Wetmoreana brouardii]